MQTEGSINILEYRTIGGLSQLEGCKGKRQRQVPYKALFLISLALLLLNCGYVALRRAPDHKDLSLQNARRTTAENQQEGKEAPTANVAPTASGAPTATIEPTGTVATTATAAPTVSETPAASPAAPTASPAAPTASTAAPAAASAEPIDLAGETNDSELYSFALSESSNVTVVFLTCCLRHEMLEETLLAFLRLNEYPFRRLVVVNDGPSNRQADQIAEKFPNLTLLSTGDKGGQLRAIDAAMRLVDTPYVFYSEDDFKQTRSGLITMNIQQLEKDPKLLQMWNAFHADRLVKGTNIVDPDWVWGGFSFQPSVWRTSDYRLIEGGFARLTRDASRGLGAGVEEVTIIREFKRRGYYVKQATAQYNVHLGKGKGLPRKG